MPDRQSHRHRRARPCVPLVDMQISPANARLQHPNLHIINADRRFRNIFQPQSALGATLNQCLQFNPPFTATTLNSDSKLLWLIQPREIRYPYMQMVPSRAALLSLFPLLLAAASPAQTSPSTPSDATALVRRAIQHRMDSDKTHRPVQYLIRKIDEHHDTTKLIVETKDGDVARLVAINGKPLVAPKSTKPNSTDSTTLPSIPSYRIIAARANRRTQNASITSLAFCRMRSSTSFKALSLAARTNAIGSPTSRTLTSLLRILRQTSCAVSLERSGSTRRKKG